MTQPRTTTPAAPDSTPGRAALTHTRLLTLAAAAQSWAKLQRRLGYHPDHSAFRSEVHQLMAAVDTLDEVNT